MNNLLIKEIYENDIENLRKIRNNCRKFMTRNKKYINKKQQLNWFQSINKNEMMPYLICQQINEVSHQAVGYAIIRFEDNRGLLSGGVINKYRGLGVGRFIFSELIKICERKNIIPALEVLKTNTRAINLYKSLGFVIINENYDIYYMEKK
ncbi:MAG: N-acetyltransferase [Alphaproteobacteria bacterium]|nr:N-acetyltransferase [Alphaproteobacteria bacterium]